VQRDDRPAEVVREHRAVVVAAAPPLQVVHAEPVHEHHGPARGIGNSFAQGLAVEIERAAVHAQRHRNRQRVARCFEMVAADAVDRRERGFALRR